MRSKRPVLEHFSVVMCTDIKLVNKMLNEKLFNNLLVVRASIVF